MRILHCCLAAFYIDDFSYQENILPRLHRALGHEVEILASTETYVDRVNLGYVSPRRYLTSEGVPITRLPYVSWLPSMAARKMRVYQGLLAELERFEPEVIFLHDCQFLSILPVARFVKKGKITLYVDSHTDFVNSGRTWVSRHILHGIVYRLCASVIAPHTKRFFPTLPMRAQFLSEVYGIPETKMTLLPFGVDDSRIDVGSREHHRHAVRRELDIPEDGFVLVAGGKIDRRKGIHTLIDAFSRLKAQGKIDNAYLLVFGKPENSLQDRFEGLVQGAGIRYVGWQAAQELYKFFWAADVAFFPGTHSVLWEEAVGLGVPCVFRRWKGIEHVDLGGNCMFLDNISEMTLANVIVGLYRDRGSVVKMREVASKVGPSTFSYTAIARRSLEM